MYDELNELVLMAQSLYDEHLMEVEGRGISYGEILHIENLEEDDLLDLIGELNLLR